MTAFDLEGKALLHTVAAGQEAMTKHTKFPRGFTHDSKVTHTGQAISTDRIISVPAPDRAMNTLAVLLVSIVGFGFLADASRAADLPNATFPLAPPPAGPPIALVGASVVDVIEGSVIPDGVIVVNGDRIAAVGPAQSVSIPHGARTLRLDGQYLIPGLINSHVSQTGLCDHA